MRIGQIAIDVAPLREGRDFRLLFTGRFASMAGNAVATTAANWQVYALTKSSLAVGALTLADSIGMFAGLMAGGMLADRYDRRILMVWTRAPLAVLAALLMVNSLLSRPALWPLYVLVTAIGALSGLGSPASTAAMPALVKPDQLAAAAALGAMSGQLGNLGGPALAGALIAGPGLAACYGIDAACFAMFGLTAWFIRPLPPTVRAGRPGLRSMAEGLRHVRHNAVVGGMLAVDTSAMIFGMPSALFPALAKEHFHGGSATFGLLAAAPAFGALLGAATSGWTGRVRRPGIVIIGAGLSWGAALVGFGFSTSLVVALGVPRARRDVRPHLRSPAERAPAALHARRAAGPRLQPVPGAGDDRPVARQCRGRGGRAAVLVDGARWSAADLHASPAPSSSGRSTRRCAGRAWPCAETTSETAASRNRPLPPPSRHRLAAPAACPAPAG